MGNPYPIEVADADGVARLQGEATFTDPANQPGGVTAHEVVVGNNVAVANNVGAVALTWDTKQLGSDLLDLSVPALPTVVAGGVYAVSVYVQPGDAMTAGGSYSLSLELDANGDDVSLLAMAAMSVGFPFPPTSISGTYLVPAGGAIRVSVNNQDGVQSIHFGIQWAVVQRLS